MKTTNAENMTNNGFNEYNYNTVTTLVNKLINGLNGKNVSDTSQAYCIAGLCRELENMVNGIPEKAVDATDLFFQSYNYAIQNGLIESIGWWDIIGNEIINYYYEIVEFDDEEADEFRAFNKQLFDEAMGE